jgi:LysR family transcriptional activator of mexEF-oprN operon
MNQSYGRDFDLNLLRVFVVVAEAGGVTAAASQLYLTQPAVSAALRRLRAAVGAPLFARAGRGLVLTAKGRRLLAAAKPHLSALVDAALTPGAFDPKSSERTVRVGLSDASESWLLPPLLRHLERDAPRMRLVVLPIQFRTVAEAMTSSRLDLAVTVADELPAGTRRRALLRGRFVCLFDPRHVALGKHPSLERYLAAEHVIVSYNGDLRGIVEDLLGVQRRVRVSVPSFQSVGAIVDGSALVATVPERVARDIMSLRRQLRSAPLPLELAGTPVELIWPGAVDDDQAVAFVRDAIVGLTAAGT